VEQKKKQEKDGWNLDDKKELTEPGNGGKSSRTGWQDAVLQPAIYATGEGGNY